MEIVIICLILVLTVFVVWEIVSRDNERKRLAWEAKLRSKSKAETLCFEDFKQLTLLHSSPPTEDLIPKLYSAYIAEKEQEQNELAAKPEQLVREETLAIIAAQEAKMIKSIQPLNIITSAEIAQTTIKSFDASKILAVSDFLSGSDIQEAIESLHETLRPIYEDALVTHYHSNLGTADIKAEHIQPQIERCMEQGFKAILKLEELQSLLGEKPELGSSKQIKKKRTWKEISGEGS